MKGMQTRLISCYNCPMKCGATISPPDKPTYMMKCFSKLTYTMAAFSDLQFGLGIAQAPPSMGLTDFPPRRLWHLPWNSWQMGYSRTMTSRECPKTTKGDFIGCWII